MSALRGWFLSEVSGWKCSLPEAAETKVAKNTSACFLDVTGRRISLTGSFTGSVNHVILDGSSSEEAPEMMRKSSQSPNITPFCDLLPF